MIRHVCMFTLKQENKEENIAEFMKRAESLRGIEEIKALDVVRNAKGTPDSNYDVALICDFDTVETLDAYQKSPIHIEFGKFVQTVKVERACIDYEF